MLLFTAFFTIALAQPKLSVDLEKLAPPKGIAEPIRKLLDEHALVVRNSRDVVMRVWFRTEIPVKATAEQIQNGLTYREIPQGTLVGAVELPAPFTDYRRQELPSGVYTLRFALQPDIGDHTGTAPQPDFCLFVACDDDKSVEEIEVKKLIELSSKVNDGRHPAVLLLWPNNSKQDKLKILNKGNDIFVVTERRSVVSENGKSTLGFALTVAGTWKPMPDRLPFP
jgi:hypothetical protein